MTCSLRVSSQKVSSSNRYASSSGFGFISVLSSLRQVSQYLSG
ncbi:unnamed protein product [Linum tenue]|uniref:Uncharacterized protein n=1 Tax=Linum tenue TaxID=586396 RepID=A0AAV0JD81_9ROSI|nr:unnamed protein product [Linum tenue]